MTGLVEVVEESVGKNAYAVGRFLQDMVDRGDLRAYSIETNKEVVLKDDDKERVVKTLKGTTFTPIDNLKYNGAILIEDPKTEDKYTINVGFFGSEDYCSGLLMRKYSKECDLQKFKFSHHSYGVFMQIPDEEVARLTLKVNMPGSYKTQQDFLNDMEGTLVVEGEQEGLFEKICEFVRKE
ncbi:hypothetical protein GOV06_01400 [Candidatus Woesearchaeota archaeon]|nr:hypothetical protein [Candidatus Woesearchaeota archaeon]